MVGELRILRLVVAAVVVVAAATGCSKGGGQSSESPTTAAIASAAAAAPVSGNGETSTRSDAPTPVSGGIDQGQVLQAFDEFRRCAQAAGLGGWVRFDPTRSVALISNVDIGADPQAGSLSLRRCQSSLDDAISSFIVDNAPTTAQGDALDARLRACASSYFPSEQLPESSVDDLGGALYELAGESDGPDALDCIQEAYAGPRITIGNG